MKRLFLVIFSTTVFSAILPMYGMEKKLISITRKLELKSISKHFFYETLNLVKKLPSFTSQTTENFFKTTYDNEYPMGRIWLVIGSIAGIIALGTKQAAQHNYILEQTTNNICNDILSVTALAFLIDCIKREAGNDTIVF